MTRRACLGWLSWGGGGPQLRGRVHPQKNLRGPCHPLLLDSAFTRVYFKVCTQMCGFWGGAQEEGSKGGCAERFEPQSPRPRGSEFTFSNLPRRLCVWFVSSGTGRQALQTPVASPPGPVLTVMPYRLIGSLGGAAGCFFLVSCSWDSPRDSDGCQVIWFCPLMSICSFPSGPNLAAKRDLSSFQSTLKASILCVFRDKRQV